jgi:protein-histidine pros-kinase
LDLAKIESGKIELSREAVSCKDVMDVVGASLRPMAESKGVLLSIQNAPETTIWTDRRALHQILLNLASNAVKFTDTGTVRIEVASTDSTVEFTVRDSGVGIRLEDQEKLFKAFSQVGSVIERNEGTGLGLHLSQKLAELLGGVITFQSEFGHGSTFKLTLDQR